MNQLEEHNLTPSAARTLLRKTPTKDRQVYVVAGQRGAFPAEVGGFSYVNVRAAVPVPKTVALDFIKDAYEETPDALVRVAIGQTVIMVGRA